MRFGKTFAAYELARRMGMRRVLVLTFKPAVEDAWQEDLERHVDFEGWQFVARGVRSYEECDPSRPIVCFGSFQDYLGVNRETGGIKARNEWVHLEDWDLVVFDEYHFGAWRDKAQDLFARQDDDVVDDAADARARRQLPRRDVAAHTVALLPLPVGHAVPGAQLGGVHRGARSSTGPTPTSSAPRRGGWAPTTPTRPCRAWCS